MDAHKIQSSNEIRYLGVYLISSKILSISLDNAKKSFYRAFNALSALEDIMITPLAVVCSPIPATPSLAHMSPRGTPSVAAEESGADKIVVTLPIAFYPPLSLCTEYRRKKLLFLTESKKSTTGQRELLAVPAMLLI